MNNEKLLPVCLQSQPRSVPDYKPRVGRLGITRLMENYEVVSVKHCQLESL